MAGAGDTTKTILWVAKNPPGDEIRRALEDLGLVLEWRALESDCAASAPTLVSEVQPGLIVCDCDGEGGYEGAFFLARSAGERPVALLAASDDADATVATTLMNALRKALPELRVSVLTDRVDENARATSGAERVQSDAREIAERLAAWPAVEPGTVVRLKGRRRER